MNSILIAAAIVAGIGLILGIGLTVAGVLLAVPVDEKAEQVRAVLPGVNCGACGYSGCDGYAEAVSSGEAAPNLCSPGGVSTSDTLAKICGVNAEIFTPKEAFINCNGDCNYTKPKLNYQGLQSCAASSMLFAGPGTCSFGCIGFGDCVAVCDYGAMSVKDKLARVNSLLCTGCGKCVSVCPKNIIELLPVKSGAFVRCSNTDKGSLASKVCSVSCISCKLCEKKCPTGAIIVTNNIAQVDLTKCTACGICEKICPRSCINILE